MTNPYTPEKVTDAREALDQLHRYSFGDNSEIDRTYVSVLVERISDALTAVSAERDSFKRQAEHFAMRGNIAEAELRQEREQSQILATELVQERERAGNYRLGAQLGTTRNKEFNEALADLARAREVIEKVRTHSQNPYEGYRGESVVRVDEISAILTAYDTKEEDDDR